METESFCFIGLLSFLSDAVVPTLPIPGEKSHIFILSIPAAISDKRNLDKQMKLRGVVR